MAKAPLRKPFVIAKRDDAQRIIYGWASVSSIRKSDGSFEPYTDLQGDQIDDEVMEAMAHNYLVHSRASKAMHGGDQIGHCIASMPLTKSIQDAFGVSCDRTGWLIGIKVTDDTTWQRVVNDEFSGLSIGGSAIYED
jgi:putative serine protease XkdF